MWSGSLTRLRRLFLKDKGLKFLSLVLAVLAWYGISGTVGVRSGGHSIPGVSARSATRKLADIPVSVLVRPDPDVSLQITPAKVSVILTGDSSELQKVTRADVRAIVDCAGLESLTNCDLAVVVNLPRWIDLTPVISPATVKVVVRRTK